MNSMLGVFFPALKKRQSMEDMVYSIQNGDFDLRNDLLSNISRLSKNQSPLSASDT